MKIRLLDWAGEPKWVEIPDDTQVIVGCILSGDMVLEHPIHADANDSRIYDFYDGCWSVERKDFDKFNQLNGSYDVFNLCHDENLN